MADDADNFIKYAYQQVPAAMQPRELKGRFNIP
ncbi:MAG: hypothetical protein QOD32_1844 [Pyrinomonadaceae bacterium]|jgi:hypothetical protein|nr:hypothetical protein [Pyrinomonadaceae bacterium]